MRQLLVLTAGGIDALFTAATGGLLLGLVVVAATGWAACQYDPHYRRVRGL